MDGAPGHYHCEVREYLDQQFPHKWIGRGCAGNLHLFKWPARSPDITPLDFFLWGYVKGQTYRFEPKNLQELKNSIKRSFELITVQMLRNVRAQFVKRLHYVIEAEGAHFENWCK